MSYCLYVCMFVRFVPLQCRLSSRHRLIKANQRSRDYKIQPEICNLAVTFHVEAEFSSVTQQTYLLDSVNQNSLNACLVSLAENATLYLNSHFLAHHNCILANFYALKCNQGIGNLQNCTGLHPGLPRTPLSGRGYPSHTYP